MYVVKFLERDGVKTRASARVSLTGIDGDAMAAAIVEAVSADMADIGVPVAAMISKWVKDELRFLSGLALTPAAVASFTREETRKVESFTDYAVRTIAELLAPAAMATAKSQGPSVLFINVPVFALHRDLRGLVQRLVTGGVRRYSEGSAVQLGGSVAAVLVKRLCAVSGLTDQEAREKPHRLRWPTDSDREGERLVRDYLGDSVLAELLLAQVRVPISDRLRMEHMVMTAGAGHGKSQTLQHMIAADLSRPKGQEVGMVVIDSQGDLISRIARLKTFAGNNRLLMIDASDVEFPVALNLFDLGGVPLSEFSAREREQIANATVGLYEFIIGGLFGAEMTQKQGVVFRFLIRLMMSIEGATIHTLRECLEEPRDFLHVMERMPGSARHFFMNEFLDRQFNETRKQIVRRLYGVLQNPAFERMFASTENKLNLYTALNAGRVVVCNTSREFLGEECRVFGRYCIAVALKAAFDRARMPMEERRTSYLYIDEASDYFDESVGQLLVQARKYKLGVILAHQALEQMSDGLRALVMSNTSLKLAGGASAIDARRLAAELRTTPEMILSQEKSAGATRFASYLRNITPAAVSWPIPFGTMERQAVMSEAEVAAMIARNRSEVSGGCMSGAGGRDGAAGAGGSRRIAEDDFAEEWT